MKEKDIFFLIEHQSTIDYNMPKRIVEYKIEIINQYIENSKNCKKKYKTPLIKAIVLYTGKGKWSVKEKIEEYAINILVETLGENKLEQISKEYLKKGGKT